MQMRAIHAIHTTNKQCKKICPLNISTGWIFNGPAQKSFKYGTGPTQQQNLTMYTGPTQGPNVGKVFYKEFLSLKKYRFLLQEKMSSFEPWEDRPQTLFYLYLKLDWLALGGTSVLS